MTRSVSAHLFSSLNGVTEDPHLFQFDSFGEQEAQNMDRSLAPITDVVIGRRLWQEWSDYWPNAEDDFGQFINPIPKHVITSTLTGELPWNSRVVTGDPVSYITSLREQDGGGVAVVGGIATIRSLFLAGVIDELTLTMHPAVTNIGRRLFDETVPLTRLHLIDAHATSVGNVILRYRLRS